MVYESKNVDIIGKVFINDNISNEVDRRNSLRKLVLSYFIDEKPGIGNKELASRHLYFAEKFSNGQILCLQRPANLKNGFDFLIYIPDSNINANGKCKDAPSFDNIIELINKNLSNNEFKISFSNNIDKIFNCYEVYDFYSLEEEIILKICKWLFIEQDIRYWHYSGRNKFYQDIKSKLI